MDAQADGRHAGVTADSTSSISAQLPIDARSAWRCRRTVEPLRDLIAPQAFDDLRLVVTELVTNAVRHGGQTGGVRLLVRCLPELVEVRVTSASGATTPAVEHDLQAGGGRLGLRVVDQLAVGWGVEQRSGNTMVWAMLPREA